MATAKIREFSLVTLFEEFLQASKSGKRLKRDGGALSIGFDQTHKTEYRKSEWGCLPQGSITKD